MTPNPARPPFARPEAAQIVGCTPHGAADALRREARQNVAFNETVPERPGATATNGVALWYSES